MSYSLCCSAVKAYKPTRTDHEAKFTAFFDWAGQNDLKEANPRSLTELAELELVETTFIIQWVKQVNMGRLLSKRYFLSPTGNASDGFYEVEENFLLDHNFEKLNTYKNYKCDVHNLFFELNLYRRNPVNKHHWRVDAARPAAEIDLGA